MDAADNPKSKDHFTPSPGKEVRFVDEAGKVVKVRNMSRAERRRLKPYIPPKIT